jgi:hypothetical protein
LRRGEQVPILKEGMTENLLTTCQSCGAGGAHHYHHFEFGAGNVSPHEHELVLCVRCARADRKRQQNETAPSEGFTRQELIAVLDNFFEASGVFDICRRCHEQGTGCCPTTCRVMGAHGCDPNNKYGKTVFCAAFVCGALLNAISECDAEIGRTLKRVKSEFGPAEFRLYEMITRVPSKAREPVLPLVLPKYYPPPVGLEDGGKIKDGLAALADEILGVRRRWHQEDKDFSVTLPDDTCQGNPAPSKY